MGIPVVKRTGRRKKVMPSEKAADEPLTFELECIVRFQQEIDTRCEGMECISYRYAVLELSNQIETLETELPKFVQSLVENYNELSADGILTEIPRLRRFLKVPKVLKEQSLGWTS
ncbi:hypothetical protein AVEN_263350-1 [Araneus ventricosus]|uniref:Uncharacterized protein n=1 Tax=Araneus ventricosus TaxID=182803 RepID=A0A4Y2D2T1_ARAVE|nr:hypothetical protein AVEN_263350-1 [Araneus ventricosus]